MNRFVLHRAWAIALRYFYLLPRDIARSFDMFYWPIMDLLLWGFTGSWMLHNEASDLKWVLIVAPIFWQVISRFTLEIPRNLLEEIWGGSVVNLLASPITTLEWLFGIVIVAVSGMLVTLVCLTGVAWLVYAFNILK